MPKATGLRCFNHSRENRKSNLKSVEITKKQEQVFFYGALLGSNLENKLCYGV